MELNFIEILGSICALNPKMKTKFVKLVISFCAIIIPLNPREMLSLSATFLFFKATVHITIVALNPKMLTIVQFTIVRIYSDSVTISVITYALNPKMFNFTSLFNLHVLSLLFLRAAYTKYSIKKVVGFPWNNNIKAILMAMLYHSAA